MQRRHQHSVDADVGTSRSCPVAILPKPRSGVREPVPRAPRGGRPWDSWDFVHDTGFRMEVKQSAAAQVWSGRTTSPPRFDIRARSGYWEGEASRWSSPGASPERRPRLDSRPRGIIYCIIQNHIMTHKRKPGT